MLYWWQFSAMDTPYNPYTNPSRCGIAGSKPGAQVGTDVLGRDTLSRVVYGARTSLEIG